MSTTTLLLSFQPDTMSPAQLAAVSYLARYAGSTHHRTPTSWRWKGQQARHHDRARGNLDRHGVHFLTAYVAGV